MGIMYAMKCDMCKVVQVEENGFDIKGRTYTENSQLKFICPKCDDHMRAAVELGSKGLNKPLTKVSGLIKERDKAKRERDEAMAALRGENPFAAVAIGHPQAMLRQKPLQTTPLIGHNREPIHTEPHKDQRKPDKPGRRKKHGR